MQIADFSYELPPEAIAHSPANPRDHSRLLVVDRRDQSLTHHHFFDLPTMCQPNWVIVRNVSKVIPARLRGRKDTGGHCEILLVRQTGLTATTTTWECLTRPGLKVGQEVIFAEHLRATCRVIEEFGRQLEFDCPPTEFLSIIDRIGEMPLPPYIHSLSSPQDLRQQYQTLYAREPGSVAAPTAGLHFTPAVEAALRDKGIPIFDVTLHVGLGTFLPVSPEQVAKHQLHIEYFSLAAETATALNTLRGAGNEIVAIGTTTARVLESASNDDGTLIAQTGETTLFIQPGYRFKAVDHLVTNFHLPKSSLLMLVSAFVSAPQTAQEFSRFADSLIGRAYSTALAEHYRFFSFGDAMLII